MNKLILIPGLPRCATTTLANILNQSEHISLGKIKEPHYFIKECSLYSFERNGKCRTFEEQGLISNERNYLLNFDMSAKYILDASTLYSAHPQCIESIKSSEIFSDVLCILLYRDSFDRALSHYLFSKSRGEEYRDFKTAILDELNGEHKNWILKGYISGSRISPFVRQFSSVYGSKKIKIIKLSDVNISGQPFIEDVCKFLDLEVFNYTKEVYQNESRNISNPLFVEMRLLFRKIRQVNPVLFDNKFNRTLFNYFMNLFPRSKKDLKEYESLKVEFASIFDEIDSENDRLKIESELSH